MAKRKAPTVTTTDEDGTGSEETTVTPGAEKAKGDVADQVAISNDQGFVGQKADPRPNEAYSLESGPDAPPHSADRANQPTVGITDAATEDH